MFSKEFLDLSQYATSKSKDKFANINAIEPNPYFIGFGNPNTDILIVGQELAIDPIKNPIALEMESYRNPEQWNKIIKDKITDIDYSFNGKNGFKNPRKPYTGIAKGTWRSYERIVEKIKNLKYSRNLEFFENCFITEINRPVSKKQKGYINCGERDLLMEQEFFKTFPVVILATGSYANRNKIEKVFNVKFSKESSNSEPHKRFEVYYSKNKDRTLINTRQLSNFRFSSEERDSYFQKIADKLK